MDAVYTAIYRKLSKPKDAATFSTLSTLTQDIFQASHQRMELSITVNTYERGIVDWIRRHQKKITGLTFRRCVTSPRFLIPCRVDALRFLYCRVYPWTFACAGWLESLKHLVIHQLVVEEEGSDCMTAVLNGCRSLETLSMTIEGGVFSLRFLMLPHLTDLAVKNPHGTIYYHHGIHDNLQTVALHASELVVPMEQSFPPTCTSLSLRSTDSFLYDLVDAFPESLHTLDLVTKGMVYPVFWNRLTSLTSFTCRCDSFFLHPLPTSLVHFDVDVSLCFVCINMAKEDLEHFKTLHYKRTTERYRVVNLLPFLE